MPVVEEFLKVSDVKSKKQFNLSIFWKVEAFSLTPGTRGFFSAVAGYSGVRSPKPRVKKPLNTLQKPETALEESLVPRVFFSKKHVEIKQSNKKTKKATWKAKGHGLFYCWYFENEPLSNFVLWAYSFSFAFYTGKALVTRPLDFVYSLYLRLLRYQ